MLVNVILQVPPVIPVTTPDIESTIATEVFPEDQFPAEGAAESVVDVPSQMLSEPVNTDEEFTVTIVVVKHPVASVYVIADVPIVAPVTMPLAEPTVATAVSDDVQVPPVIAFASVVVEPIQVVSVPEIEDGAALTVNTEVILQPVAVI